MTQLATYGRPEIKAFFKDLRQAGFYARMNWDGRYKDVPKRSGSKPVVYFDYRDSKNAFMEDLMTRELAVSWYRSENDCHHGCDGASDMTEEELVIRFMEMAEERGFQVTENRRRAQIYILPPPISGTSYVTFQKSGRGDRSFALLDAESYSVRHGSAYRRAFGVWEVEFHTPVPLITESGWNDSYPCGESLFEVEVSEEDGDFGPDFRHIPDEAVAHAYQVWQKKQTQPVQVAFRTSKHVERARKVAPGAPTFERVFTLVDERFEVRQTVMEFPSYFEARHLLARMSLSIEEETKGGFYKAELVDPEDE
jgi:hypothetical protein